MRKKSLSLSFCLSFFISTFGAAEPRGACHFKIYIMQLMSGEVASGQCKDNLTYQECVNLVESLRQPLSGAQLELWNLGASCY